MLASFCSVLRRSLSLFFAAALILPSALVAQPRVAQAASTSALAFNGNSSFVQVPANTSLNISSNLTLETWAKPTAVNAFADIVGAGGYELGIRPSADGFMAMFQIVVGGTTYSATSATAGPMAPGQWYHFAGTYDGNTVRLFVNGVQLGTTVKVGAIDSSTVPLRIASSQLVSDFFTGEVDEVRVSNTVRYINAFTPPTAPFVTDANTAGLWHLDEGTGTTTADASGHGNNGSLSGAARWVTDSPVGLVDLSLPTPSAVTLASISATVATVSWTTNKPSSSQASFGTTPAYGATTPVDPSVVTSHKVTLSGLTPNTSYNYQVISRDASGNVGSSPNLTFSSAEPSMTSAVTGEWSPVHNWPLVPVHSTLLYTGDVLMWDAWESPGTPSVRLWHPATDTFTAVPNLVSQIFCSGHVVLSDGRILVVGGHNGGEVGITDTNMFDPATSRWSLGASMHFPRWYPSANELGDGRVVAFSGNINHGTWANTPEVYNPVSNTWTSLTSISTADVTEGEYPLSFALPSGKLFTLASSTGKSKLLDVNSLSYTAATTSLSPALFGSAAMYRPGKVINSGGGPAANNASWATSAVIDMTAASPAWRQIAPMAFPRYQHTLTMLPDGKVLAVGGGDAVDGGQIRTGPLAPEMWDPTTETWSTLASSRYPRMYHSETTLLPDGRILVSGGGRWSTAYDYYNAEIYSPPYLFKGPRPSVSGAPASAGYGTPITITTPDAATIATVALTALDSTTHTSNTDQHYVELPFSRGANSLNVFTPASSSLAPPGFYLLWLVDSNGVPSMGKQIKIGGPQTDTQPPTVSLTAPASGATVSGTTTTISASASDNVGVTSVQFLLDGNPIGLPVATAPYTVIWDTTTTTNGTHAVAARASDAAGNTTSSAVNVSVSNPLTISGISSSSITPASAVVSWTTNSPATSQVLYGTTTSYGSSTALDATLVTAHSQTLSSLTPSTLYHYQVQSRDSSGRIVTSSDQTFTTGTALIGDATVRPNVDSSGAGGAEAFQYTATTSGSANKLFVYLDGSSTAAKVVLGLYADNASTTSPAALLAQATITAPIAGAWNSVAIPPTGLTAGTKYWIAILGPAGTGTVAFRDVASGGPAQASSQTTLATLPATWSPGSNYPNSPMSAYATGSSDTVPPTVSLTAPTAGASLVGSATVSATASDNVGVTSVQLLLDGAALGPPLTTAPYTYNWDTTTATNGSHTLGARASDAAGNIGTASTVSVTSSNPPSISAVTIGSITPVGAAVSWNTNTPATSQVEYGVTTAYGSTTTLDATLVTAHLQSLTGLTPNTLYNCAVISRDQAGTQVVSNNVTFTTPAFVSSNVQAKSVTSTSATITWTTNGAASSQVQYGTSTAYGSSTTLDSSLLTSHSQTITGLTPGTLYHYQVQSKDAYGNTAGTTDQTFTTAAAAPTVLVGDTTIEGSSDSNGAGAAEAFQYTSSASGSATKLFIYLDVSSSAPKVVLGLYAHNATTNSPGSLLAQGTISTPRAGDWNSATIPSTALAAGTKYWIAVLGPAGSGMVAFRDVLNGGPAQGSSQSNLTTLPATWSKGSTWGNSPMSAYAQ
jgi:hypothetical protein